MKPEVNAPIINQKGRVIKKEEESSSEEEESEETMDEWPTKCVQYQQTFEVCIHHNDFLEF